MVWNTLKRAATLQHRNSFYVWGDIRPHQKQTIVSATSNYSYFDDKL